MARNSELIRQWEILRAIDAARGGIPVAKLAATRAVHPRTIRRDLEALAKAGFPLYDDHVNGTTMWKLGAKPFRGLTETGLGVTELCALYFSRSIMKALAGAPFQEEIERAFAKLESALSVASRKFLNRFPIVLTAKSAGRKMQDSKKTRAILIRVLDAALRQRRVTMRYDSRASGRTKDYKVDPLRLSYADGGIYLIAWVEEYGQVRTFATERIRTLAVLDEHFDARALTTEPFANSIGAHSGSPSTRPVRVEIEFDARVADYVKERERHPSQQNESRPDGSLLVRLTVSDDRPLRSWIHSFGPLARVIAPAALAQEMFEEIDETRDLYAPRLTFDVTEPAIPPTNRPLPTDSRTGRLPLTTR
jgi:predicted DNA-binding transcriptional regulator YafY